MNRADESIVNWNENVTLRRFLIVSSLVLSWIACDLVLHAIALPHGIDMDLDETQLFSWLHLRTSSGVPSYSARSELTPLTNLAIVGNPRYGVETAPDAEGGSQTKASNWTAGRITQWLRDLLPAGAWRLHLYTAYSLPALGLLALVLLDRLVNQGKTRLPWGITVCGGLFIVGGALIDMAVTVAHSPNLEMEGNPYIRILLDSQHSLPFVYAHALFTQSLYITLFCGIWIGFLRHRQIIVQTIAAGSPGSWIDFLKAATGGSHLTIRQWLFPIHMSEIPRLYHYVWVIAIPVVFGISLFRWYAAMEWLGLVEPDVLTRLGVVLHGVFSTLILYFLVLWRLYQQSQASAKATNLQTHFP